MAVPPTEINPEQIKTFKEFLSSYNKLSEICFLDCVNDFTSRTIKPYEVIIIFWLFGRFQSYYSGWFNLPDMFCVYKSTCEDKCSTNCTEKYLKMNQRISQRFQEFQIISNDNLAAAQKLGNK
ncbi:mitochondrial import inner membrane translocase subunit Tim9 isoform X1 [Cimex lectularius]|uniref:Mitochondrial import inner membrane translocase subunit n=1 Tax=Cimex lectularius TaxID=79782 RepID=A0A8I6S0C1_CIMLE|nr:mitochondrial import inner membrane translocase subunit Tim9 isoform X1 [Cimex lectularius]